MPASAINNISALPQGNQRGEASSSTASPVEIGLRHHRQTLELLWKQGLSGKILLQEHTRLVDEHLQRSFANCKDASQGFALLALGGYGRSELFPFSDIDLLLLYAPENKDNVNAVAEAIFYPLWDAGLEVGHGVRTITECLVDAKNDFFFQVALLDARLVAGSKPLFEQLIGSFTLRFVEGLRRQFLKQITDHRSARHNRFGQHSYMLEPHIKESRGGLRDIQSMLWTARVVFGLDGIEAMLEAGLLTDLELKKFSEAWNHLIKIRNRLHHISGRKNDQLFFEHQEEMARAFAYRDANDFLGVEHFMRDVHAHLQSIAVTTDLFFDHVNELFCDDHPKEENHAQEPGLDLWRGRIHLTEPELQANRSLLMKVFLLAARTGAPLHHRTRRLISAHTTDIDNTQRKSRRLAKYFVELLTEAVNPLAVLETMLETGLLPAYIPEFANVQSMAQHDIYHVYTVDIHMLQTVNELHKLKQEQPQIFKKISTPHILFLAGLLHDIGKGHGKNHAEKGAHLSAVIGKRLGLPENELADLTFLVLHHLFLSHTAHRRDLEDQELIVQCAEFIESQEKLAMLYLLTVADARATGPNAWGEWKAALVLELYLKTEQLLDTSAPADPDCKPGLDGMRGKIKNILGKDGETDLQFLPNEYLLHFTPEAIAEQIKRRKNLEKEKVLVFPEEKDGHWSVLIMTADRPGLLAKICGVLALHNLKILAAQIFTWPDGTAVDTLHVASLVEEDFANQDWAAFQNDIALAINQRVGLEHRLGRKLPPTGQYKPTNISRRPAQVVINNSASEKYTIIEVFADDRFGLLYDITKVMGEFGIDIARARIASRADQVVDVFYVLDQAGNKITDPSLQEEIRLELLHGIKGPTD